MQLCLDLMMQSDLPKGRWTLLSSSLFVCFLKHPHREEGRDVGKEPPRSLWALCILGPDHPGWFSGKSGVWGPGPHSASNLPCTLSEAPHLSDLSVLVCEMKRLAR